MNENKCNFIPPTPGYAPCSREKGHDGPCAHEFSDLPPRIIRWIISTLWAVATIAASWPIGSLVWRYPMIFVIGGIAILALLGLLILIAAIHYALFHRGLFEC